jgi:hypothetical protein
MMMIVVAKMQIIINFKNKINKATTTIKTIKISLKISKEQWCKTMNLKSMKQVYKSLFYKQGTMIEHKG